MANATSAGLVVEVGKEEFTISKLQFVSLESLELYVRGRVIEAARESLADETDKATRDETMRQAFDYADSISLADGDFFNRRLSNPSGSMRMIYYSLKQTDSTITLARVRSLCEDKAVRIQFMEALNQVMTPGDKPKNPPTPTPEVPVPAEPETRSDSTEQAS